ncbi:MAG: D-aminoacylase, partial [Gemmatimonadetes bacterium]|nr:D-aminoacylase [Gemmatimonadota bacterium]
MKTARRKALAAALAAGAILLAAACTDAAPPSDSYPFDILITDARVIDGTGGPPADADVGVRGDRIMAVGDLSDREAARTIDAAGRVVAPGFVDMMGQASLVLITDPPSAESKLRQGITTYLSGE